MSISARFEADFTSFQSAVRAAETSLKSFEAGAGRVETSLNKMVDSLSGRRIIQDAGLMAEAVERIGGTSKLTGAELERLGAQAAAAVEKMKALGLTVPASLQKIADGAKLSSRELDNMSTFGVKAGSSITEHGNRAILTQERMIATAKNLAATLGVTFSVQALIGFGQHLLDVSDQLVKTSDRTGLTIEQVQRLSFVADQSGNSLEQLTTAVGKMQVNLNDAKAQASLRALNVDLEKLRSSGPYDSLRLIAAGFAGIKDPVQQAEHAVAIFQKNGLEILPTLKSAFDDLANSVQVASDKQVRALEEAGDALARLKTKATNWAVGTAGNVALVAEEFGTLKTAVAILIPGISMLAGLDFSEMVESAQAAAQSVEQITEAVKKNPLVEFRKHLASLRKESADLTDTQQVLIRQGHELGLSNSEIATGLGNISERAVDAYLKMIEGSKKAAEETEKLREAEKKLFFEIRMWGVHQLEEMTKEVNAELRKQMDAMGVAATQIFGMQQEGAARIKDLFGNTAPISGMEAEIAKLDARFKDYTATLNNLSATAGPAWQATAEQIKQQLAVEYDRTFTDIVTKAGNFNGEVAGTVASGAAGMGAAADTAMRPAVSSFTQAFNQITVVASTAMDRVKAAMQLDQAYRDAGFMQQNVSFDANNRRRETLFARGQSMPTSVPSLGAVTINVSGGATWGDGKSAADGFVDTMKKKGVQV